MHCMDFTLARARPKEAEDRAAEIEKLRATFRRRNRWPRPKLRVNRRRALDRSRLDRKGRGRLRGMTVHLNTMDIKVLTDFEKQSIGERQPLPERYPKRLP